VRLVSQARPAYALEQRLLKEVDGEVLFDAGELSAAADELMRAYMAEGAEIFAAENPRYLAFLKTRAKI
jgi:hypothetical protein